jgi:hypothetical protein
MNYNFSVKNSFSLFIILFFSLTLKSHAQLKPGFDANEYMDLLRVSSQHLDSLHPSYVLPLPGNYKKIYRSPVLGLQNRFDIWLKDSSIGIISIRATVSQSESWIENFYMGMIANQGSITISNKQNFSYKIAEDTNAYVHIGWMLGLAYMAPDIVAHINELYKKGVKSFIIMGHSQGGALAFLLRSYLQYLDEKTLPKDLVYKTYCSAPPKPGNLFYSYDYDYITRNGWGFRVVNKLDWVPESPFTVQTGDDVNSISPMRNRKESMNRLGFASKIYLKHVYRKLNHSTKKSLRLYNKYLGHMLYRIIKKNHPEYKEPPYKPSVNYSIAGTPIILVPTPSYKESFPDKGQNAFLHHSYKSYLFLTQENFGK